MTFPLNKITNPLDNLTSKDNLMSEGTDNESVHAIVNSLYTAAKHFSGGGRSLGEQGAFFQLAHGIAKDLVEQVRSSKNANVKLTSMATFTRDYLKQKMTSVEKQIVTNFKRDAGKIVSDKEKKDHLEILEETEGLPEEEQITEAKGVLGQTKGQIPFKGLKQGLDFEQIINETQKLGILFKNLTPNIAKQLMANADPEFLLAEEVFFNNFSDIVNSSIPNKQNFISNFLSFSRTIDPNFSKLISSLFGASPEIISLIAGEFEKLANSLPESISEMTNNQDLLTELALRQDPNFIPSSSSNFLKTAIANFKVIQPFVNNQQGLEAAFHFAEVFPGEVISNNPAEMLNLIQNVATATSNTKNVLLNMPLPPNEFGEIANQISFGQATFQKSVQMAQIFLPGLNVQNIKTMGFLSSEDLIALKGLNENINSELDTLNDLKKEIAEADSDRLASLIADYKNEKENLLNHLKDMNAILPEYDSSKVTVGLLTTQQLDQLLINLLVMDYSQSSNPEVPALQSAKDSLKVIAQLEEFFIKGAYRAEKHNSTYRSAWKDLEQHLAKAKQNDATFNPETLTRQILPKNALVDLEKRTQIDSMEKATEKMNAKGFMSGQWMLVFNENDKEMLKLTRKGFGQLSKTTISSINELRPLLTDLVNGVIK